jgi:hypothetical protein
MEETDRAFEEIEANFEAFRRAVEERNYSSLELLLREQRSLMSSLPICDARSQTLALRGSALISWALTMVKIHHAGYVHELSAMLNARHLNAQYGDTMASRQELVSLNA